LRTTVPNYVGVAHAFLRSSCKKPCSAWKFGAEIGQREVAVRDRLRQGLQGLAAVLVAMALYGATGAAPLHAQKRYARKPPVQQLLPPVRYIHCAMELGEEPCGLDPAMQRLRGEPPDRARRAPPFDQPDSSPGLY
jgi:hypothetical protein